MTQNLHLLTHHHHRQHFAGPASYSHGGLAQIIRKFTKTAPKLKLSRPYPFQIQGLGGSKTSSSKYRSLEVNSVAVSDPKEATFEVLDGQSRVFHELPSGLKLEVIQQMANPRSSGKHPIVFLHGSYHAAWCWAVKWLPFFSSQGHDCFAISFLGQGESDTPPSGVGGTLQSHARDVAHYIRHKVLEAPVLVGHSFGGLIVQQYLANVTNLGSKSPPKSILEGWEEPYPRLAAVVLACSVPPTGNGPLVKRYLMTKPLASIKVTLSLAAKAFAYNESLCKETFFSSNMPLSLVQVYQKLLANSSNVPLFNLRELNATLPVDPPSKHAPPILVVGAENDFVVDVQGINDTAAVYGNNLVLLPSIAHDIMLDTEWKAAAEVVIHWLQTTTIMDSQSKLSV